MAKLTAGDDSAADERLGGCVSLSSDGLAALVGAWQDDIDGHTDKGSVRVSDVKHSDGSSSFMAVAVALAVVGGVGVAMLAMVVVVTLVLGHWSMFLQMQSNSSLAAQPAGMYQTTGPCCQPTRRYHIMRPLSTWLSTAAALLAFCCLLTPASAVHECDGMLLSGWHT